MPAYDTRQHEQSARSVNVETAPSVAVCGRICQDAIGAANIASLLSAADAGSVADALIGRLADRLAAALMTRLGGEQAEADEWLDSRQAAEYLGVHRDTLRRLAAARAIPAGQDGRGCKLFFRRATLDDWRRNGGRLRHLAAVVDAA